MAVARAVPRAVKRLEGVLVADSLNLFPLTDTTRDLAAARGLQARAAAEVAAVQSAESCTMQDSDWPPAVSSRTRDHASRAMRAAFAKTLCMEVWADQM